jgi:hypothetical protein
VVNQEENIGTPIAVLPGQPYTVDELGDLPFGEDVQYTFDLAGNVHSQSTCVHYTQRFQNSSRKIRPPPAWP